MMAKPLNPAATLSLAKECVDLVASGHDQLPVDHPLMAELRELDNLTRSRIEWYVLGHKAGRDSVSMARSIDALCQEALGAAGIQVVDVSTPARCKTWLDEERAKIAAPCHARAAAADRRIRLLSYAMAALAGAAILWLMVSATSCALSQGGAL